MTLLCVYFLVCGQTPAPTPVNSRREQRDTKNRSGRERPRAISFLGHTTAVGPAARFNQRHPGVSRYRSRGKSIAKLGYLPEKSPSTTLKLALKQSRSSKTSLSM
jgi:hypothetical protein